MSNICYIILTCEKYLPTRATWQRRNCFKYTKSSNLYYLSCKPGPNSVYGWNTTDDYISCPLKYIEFFRNMDLKYDWYVFLDDDSFVFPNRYRDTLKHLDSSKNLYIGLQLEHMSPFLYMGGGATFTLSKGTYNLVKNYIRNSDINCLKKYYGVMIHGDVSIGMWISKLKMNNIEYINLPLKFSSNPHKTNIELHNNCSFHYLSNKEQFEFYGKLVCP